MKLQKDMETKILQSINLIRYVSGASLNLFRYTAMVLVLFVLGIGQVWAGSASTQARAYLKDGSPSGSGKVYIAANSATAPSDNQYKDCTADGITMDGTSGKNKKSTFYFYAKAKTGYKFTGWYKKNTDDSFTLVTADASWSGSVTSPSSEPTVGTSYTYLDRYAEFVKIVSYSFVVPEDGSFTITNDGKPVANYATIEAEGVVHVSATPTEGYRFGGWYSTTDGGITRKYFAFTPETDLSFSDDATIGADFRLDNGDALFSVVNGGLYDNLNLATTAANSVSPNIVLVAQDGILRSGNYTIPSGVSLLVPYNKETSIQKKPTIINKDLALSVYRKLVFEEGANITCNGAICVGGQQMCANGGAPSGYTCGACGQIDMSAGGQITLNSGANLYAWGFITGQDLNQGNNTVGAGTITANTGSTVWECFAVGDWRGGTASSNIISTRFFPFQSYFIQNIEVPLAIKNGASEKCYAAVNASGTNYQLPATVIGATDALFKLTDENSLVRKWFDATTDLICYELSGTANLDAIKIENLPVIGTINSSEFDLPITSNMHLILTNSSVTLSKPMVMQPGAKIEIKEDASVTVATKIYIYDNDNWGAYAGPNYYFHNYGNANGILTRHKNRGNGQSKALLDDAQIILDGMVAFGTSGELYSTAGGADIMGNGDGYIVFPSSIVTSSEKIDAFTSNGDKVSGGVAVNQANLCNEDGSYTKAIASTTFHNVNGRWFKSGNQNENADHTYNFTYIASGAVSGTGGTDVSPNTHNALYAPDKTGLTAGMKWCNVEQDGTCSNIFNATQALNETPASDIRYTYPSDSWLQLLRTETEGVYGGSDNSLYAVDGCAVNSLGSVDENCLYTIGGVKKALVNGKFVALAKNTADEAWHDVANPTNYYISFAGCTWHPATKYAGEEKAYSVEGGIYIWYNNDWLLVEREDPFFFDYNDQNVKRYYEYENGEWVLAEPKVRVTDAIETREFFFLPEAFAVANGKKNATITILKDISGIATSLSFTAANTTCTLDLNGHTVRGTANKLLNINGSGSTFTITDSQTGGTLKMTGTPNNACYYNVYVTNGSLMLNNGTISVDNAAAYSGDNYALCAVGVASGKSFTMNNGTINARVDRRAYGIESNGTTNINGGTITCQTLRYAYPYGVQVKAGTTTIKNGVTITTTAGTTYSFPVYQTGGTLKVTGGTMTATAPTTSNDSYFNSAIRIDGGTANISNATLSATVTGNSNSKNAYGIYSKGTTTISNCVVSATTKTSGAYAVYTAGGTTTIKSGKFKASAPSAVAGVYKNAGTITIEDGYFVQNTNLEANLAANRGVYKLTSGTEYSEGYQYDIDKAYTLTWVTDGNDLTGNYTKGKTRVGATITMPSTPTKTGYTFKEWTPTPAATMPSEDKTYTATWTPNTNTKYTVKHMREALDGTYPAGLTETENQTGTTATETAASTKSYTGFTAPATQTKTIAADGSMEIAYYYTRNSYTLSWVTDGDALTGSYTNGSTKYGAAITAPNTPTKTGYTFAGWSPAKAETMPAAATEYTATWTINQYTLTVLSANETMGTVTGGGKYDYNASHTITATPKTGYKFVQWNDGNENAERSVTVTADVTYTATFDYDIANYTVKHWQQNINNDEYTEVVTDRQTNLSGTIGTTTTAEAKEYTGFDAQPFSQQTIEVSGTVVNIYYNRNTYTITWVDGDENTIKTDEKVKYGATPSYTGETPTKSNSETQSFVFNNTWSPAVTAVTDNAIYTAQFKAYDLDLHVTEQEQNTINEDVTITTTTVENGGTLTVGDKNNGVTLQSNTIIVESGGQLDVAKGGSINADVFIIQATTEDQGEDNAKEEVQVSGELSETGSKNLHTIYYDLTRKHGTENFLARVWYAVAVPWAVETPNYDNGGVFIKRGEEFIPQRLGATFDLLSYDGECRATNGASANCWVYLEDEIDAGTSQPVMVPGKLYMIYLTEETSTIRFKKKAGVDIPIHTNSLEVTAYAETTPNDGKDANWNGIANPATYRAYMNVSVKGLVQKFIPGTQPRDRGRYLPINLNDKQSVGQPLFVQVDPEASTSVVVTRTQNNPSALAPRRVQAQSDPEVRYAISIAANGKLADRLYIQTAEEKEDKYVIGKDMSKMSVSSYVAQMWVDRYDSKLCLNTAVLDRDKASYPLGIYAPQAGEYKIFAPADIETNDNIYLTLDGRVIWNLTMSPYYASLEQGTTTRYGLRLVRNTPAVQTGVDETQSGKTQCMKVIMDDHVYILRGEELYTITGQKAK